MPWLRLIDSLPAQVTSAGVAQPNATVELDHIQVLATLDGTETVVATLPKDGAAIVTRAQVLDRKGFIASIAHFRDLFSEDQELELMDVLNSITTTVCSGN